MQESTLKVLLHQITVEDYQAAVQGLVQNKGEIGKQFNSIISNISHQFIENGMEMWGGAKQFSKAIVIYITFRTALRNKHISDEDAMAISSILVFGRTEIGKAIATTTGDLREERYWELTRLTEELIGKDVLKGYFKQVRKNYDFLVESFGEAAHLYGFE